MKKRWLAAVAVACVGIGWTAAEVFSQDGMGGEPPAGGGAPAAGPTAEEQAAEMAAWMAYMTPGAEHARLAKRVGKWTCTTKSWMAPGTEPMESEGATEFRMILGGRYLQQDYSGTSMGMPFEGLGVTGFDNAKKVYETAWLDSMGTGVLKLTGTPDATCKVFTFTGEMPNPQGGVCAMRIVETEKDADTVVMEMFVAMGGRPEAKFMEMTYRRVKDAAPVAPGAK